jgi:hypothetical protein
MDQALNLIAPLAFGPKSVVAVKIELGRERSLREGFSTEATLMVAARMPLARCAAMRVSSADVVGGMGVSLSAFAPRHGSPCSHFTDCVEEDRPVWRRPTPSIGDLAREPGGGVVVPPDNFSYVVG